MRLADFDYAFPTELVAQHPLPQRDDSRLLALDRNTGDLQHRTVRELPLLLRPGDLLVVNSSRVLPYRLIGRREGEGNGTVEVLLLRRLPHQATAQRWLAIGKPLRRFHVGMRIEFGPTFHAHIIERRDDQVVLDFGACSNFDDLLLEYGLPPLPPYIRRPGPAAQPEDFERYQTIYAGAPGSAAAPTAGLHFSEALCEACAARGIRMAKLVLHVGLDTFQPVRVDDLAQHTMHGESYIVPQRTVEQLKQTRADGGRIVAVGTTAVRALESFAATGQPEGDTELFITPGYRFQLVDALLTNFHQPRSTLLMLVAAFAGLDRIKVAYATAIAEHYRLFSYGDAMLIL